MEENSGSDCLFNSDHEEKLRHEISVLKAAMAKIERNSANPREQELYRIYERILERRKKLLQSIS